MKKFLKVLAVAGLGWMLAGCKQFDMINKLTGSSFDKDLEITAKATQEAGRDADMNGQRSWSTW